MLNLGGVKIWFFDRYPGFKFNSDANQIPSRWGTNIRCEKIGKVLD